MTRAPAARVFSEEELTALGEEAFLGCPISRPAAVATISRLVATEMYGISSHGFAQLARYVRMLRSGAIDGSACPEILADSGAVILLDALHGMGHHATSVAVELAVGKASELGGCVVSVRRSNHFGAAFPYCADLAEAGYIAFLVTNAPANMAPWGGIDRTIGNNPFSWAIPRRGAPPLVLDIACSVAAGARMSQTGADRGQLPADWAIDERGAVTTDPLSVYSYLPIGGHKGYGIALVNEVLTGVLSGSLFGLDLPPRESLGELSWDVGHLLVAFDPAVLCPRDDFLDRMDRLAEMVAASRLRDGFDEVVLPGEPEYRALRRHRSSGVELPEALVEELRQMRST